MNTREATTIMMNHAWKKHGEDGLNEDAAKKAIAKLKRWLTAAHGSLEWDELNDVTENFDFYYHETLNDKTNGKDTSNRQGFGNGLNKIIKGKR